LDRRLAKLLDFGVIRPLDLTNVTDEGDRHYFIGTLQYSPPELLFREEQQSVEGWRAITFYQLGAVLHDLLMRKALFSDFTNPYARLVRAVEREVPHIDSAEADPHLRLLAQNCLAKIPSQRLDNVKWEDFSRPKLADPMDAARRKIAQHRAASAQLLEGSSAPEDLLGQQCFALRTSIHSSVVSTIKAEPLPRHTLQHIREPNPYLLRALFEPSAKDGLEQYFSCYFQGTVIDTEANLQELQFWACVGPARERIPAEPDPQAPHSTLRGALTEQDIRAHVQENLLLAYADGLDSPIAPEPVSWLKVGAVI
jgi:serine/threonine protein kinase